MEIWLDMYLCIDESIDMHHDINIDILGGKQARDETLEVMKGDS
jgi:hypothetical protein